MKLTQFHIARIYQRMQIETAPRGKLIVMLHEKSITLSKEAVSQAGIERRTTLDTAQNILVLLQRSLRIEDEVSQSLFYIYDYVYALLEKGGNEECRKAIQVMTVISDAFREVLTRR